MLADPRSESMVTNFAAQWLYLRDVDVKDPDLFLFRDFDEGLRKSFERETELFLDSILRENRSVLELLTANYTFVNERLAKHYGIPNIRGSQFRRVTFPTDSPRGGLLGQGSILTADVLLHAHVAGAARQVRSGESAGIAAASSSAQRSVAQDREREDPANSSTLREAMVQHRANPACASCHARMDPIGFAMENFDAVGQWRDQDAGKPIDVSSTLADGTEVDGVAGVKQLLLQRSADASSAR